MNTAIMVVTHKQTELMNDSLYHPIIVGNQNFEIENAWRDNSGENIASKNPYYCELTALYWVWKNKLDNYENIGLCHYRRYFTKYGLSNSKRFFLNVNDVNYILNKYDIILPKPYLWKFKVKEEYYEFDKGAGKLKDLELTREAIIKLYPEYLDAFDKVLNSKGASYCNMFIMKAIYFNKYCCWLFDVLAYVEKNIDMTGYNVQEQRVFGYLSELLLNVWVEKKALRIKYYDIAYFAQSRRYQIKVTLKNWIKIICNYI